MQRFVFSRFKVITELLHSRNQSIENIGSNQKERILLIDLYLIFHLLVEGLCIGLTFCEFSNYLFIEVLALIFVTLRCIDIVQVNVNLLLFDQLRIKHSLNISASSTRSIILLFINILELIICFGVIYSFNSSYLEGVNSISDAYYFSFITQLSLGTEIGPIGWMRPVVIAQLGISYFFSILVLGKIVGSFPNLKYLTDSE